VTAVAPVCELSFDQRHLDDSTLEAALDRLAAETIDWVSAQ
jgi:hypothetical protein